MIEVRMNQLQAIALTGTNVFFCGETGIEGVKIHDMMITADFDWDRYARTVKCTNDSVGPVRLHPNQKLGVLKPILSRSLAERMRDVRNQVKEIDSPISTR